MNLYFSFSHPPSLQVRQHRQQLILTLVCFMHSKALALPENDSDSVDRWLAQSPGFQILINIVLTAEKFKERLCHTVIYLKETYRVNLCIKACFTLLKWKLKLIEYGKPYFQLGQMSGKTVSKVGILLYSQKDFSLKIRCQITGLIS